MTVKHIYSTPYYNDKNKYHMIRIYGNFHNEHIVLSILDTGHSLGLYQSFVTIF